MDLHTPVYLQLFTITYVSKQSSWRTINFDLITLIYLGRLPAGRARIFPPNKNSSSIPQIPPRIGIFPITVRVPKRHTRTCNKLLGDCSGKFRMFLLHSVSVYLRESSWAHCLSWNVCRKVAFGAPAAPAALTDV
jgi:hypothetical protein